MSGRIYRVLLRLLPRRRRRRYGDDMAMVFDQLSAAELRERGAAGLVGLWMKEVAGMVRFVGREWLRVVGIGRITGECGPGLATELLWAWRGVRGRGWRAVFAVGLLAVTFGVTAATFSIVDSLVFHQHPYPDADRIVSLDQFAQPERRPGRLQSAALERAWREQTDVFAAVGGYLSKGGVFLQDQRSSERIDTADVTLGFFDVLGVRPRWGRAFTEDDLRDSGAYAAILSDALARQRFGSPQQALGQKIDATGGALIVVGVMPSTFAFPSASTDVWRAMDPAGPLTTNFGGVGLMGRLAADVSHETLPARLAERTAAIAGAAGLPLYRVEVRPHFADTTSPAGHQRRTLLLLLLGSATALLLTSCANVVSVELAHALRRSHTRAIQLALGASRLALARIGAIEAAALVGASLVAGLGVASLLLGSAVAYLPEYLPLGTQNPFDLDTRALWFSVLIAIAAWSVLSVTGVVTSFRSATLAPSGRAIAGGRSDTGARRLLTGVEVGLAVALVVVGLLYARSYQALLGLDKGFDSSGLAVVEADMPVSYFASDAERMAFVARLTEEVRRLPGVSGATRSAPPPSLGDSPSSIPLEVDGQTTGSTINLGRKWIDEAYFDVMGLPLSSGRHLQPGDAMNSVVISDTFARRFWPDGDAVGHSFRGGNGFFREPSTVVGVVKDVRVEPTRMPDVTDDRMYVYTHSAPPPVDPAPTAPRVTGVDSGGSFAFMSITVRVGTPDALASVRTAVQRSYPRLAVEMEMVDDIYAGRNADVLLATQVVGAFSVVSFLVAMAGLYGVIAFMVASRTREIGIRMALGAARHDIRQMVVMSSARIVVAGSFGGVAAGFGAARWIESQLFGVSTSDPTTYVVVVAAVAVTALVATWQPTHQATLIDPAIALRIE